MTTALSIATSPVDINMVGKSWTQANKASFLCSKIASVRVRDRRSGTGSTSYELPALDNFMLKGSLLDWEPGQSLPVSDDITSTTVTVTPKGRSTHPITRPLNRDPGPHVFQDLESNIVPGRLSLLYQGLDKDIYTNLSTVANWSGGAAKTFAGSNALDAVGSHSGQSPDNDINTELQAFRKFQGAYKLVCIMDSHVAQVLARHPVYTGAGTGSAIASTILQSEFMPRFQGIHMFDEVILTSAVSDTVRLGQTSSINHITNGLLWMGLLDKRTSMDLTTPMSFDSPDGAICVATSREPEVVSGIPELSELEHFVGRTSYKVFNPRGSSFGIVWKASGANGIFTALPS